MNKANETQNQATVSLRRYQYLINLPHGSLSEKEREELKIFETEKKQREKTAVLRAKNEKTAQYLTEIKKSSQQPKKRLNSKEIVFEWKRNFESIAKTKLVLNNQVQNLLWTLAFYFSGEEKFFDSPLVLQNHNPSLEKGLLIIGDYGTGKSTALKVMQHVLQGSQRHFYMAFAPSVVDRFEEAKATKFPEAVNAFWNTHQSQERCYDDVFSERMASAYGKVDVVREILEKRYDRKLTTHIIANYASPHDANGLFTNRKSISETLEFIKVRYGSRVGSRAVEMFNVIEVKGDSFRV